MPAAQACDPSPEHTNKVELELEPHHSIPGESSVAHSQGDFWVSWSLLPSSNKETLSHLHTGMGDHSTSQYTHLYHTHTHTCTLMHTYEHNHMYMHTCKCMHIDAYMQMNTRAHAHTYIHANAHGIQWLLQIAGDCSYASCTAWYL